MTFTRTLPVAATPEISGRDTVIDAVRAVCLLAVVVLHALMVGVEITAADGLHTSVALSGEAWFVPITWLLQVMPLFFIAGGFASLSQWRRMRARGASAAEYVAGRVRRLTTPAVAMVAVVGGVLLSAAALGADPALVEEASLRIGQPLWFLAVYLGVTALVPAMAWLHERRPLLTFAALGLGVVVIDLVSARTGLPIGYLNLALVWPLMQQLGFAMLDGVCAAASRRGLLSGMMAALAAILVLIACGWSPDMLHNLNPPTAAIALLGAAQFFTLQLLRPRLDAMTRLSVVEMLVAKAGTRAMAVYLWHMPVILALVVILWGAGLPLPEPHSGAWWATRIPWLLTIAVCVIPTASLASRFERRTLRPASMTAPRVSPNVLGRNGGAALGVLFSIGGTATALLAGMASPAAVLFALALLVGGVTVAPAPRSRLHRGGDSATQTSHR